MTVDRSALDGFSDYPVDSGQQEYIPPSDYVPPPQPATYKVVLFDIAECKESMGVVNATLTYKIIGTEYDDRELQFQRVSSATFDRGKGKASSLDDVLWAGRAPEADSPKGKALALFDLMDAATPFEIVWGWRGFCVSCYEKQLMDVTERDNPEEAKKIATKQQRKDAAKFATIKGGSKAFPVDGDGKRTPFVDCPNCGAEIRAQGNIITYKRCKDNVAADVTTPF